MKTVPYKQTYKWLNSPVIYSPVISPVICIALGLVLWPFTEVRGQIIPDNALGGERSIVNSTGNRDRIDGGATRDSNLFHSFEQFGIEAGREAYFANPAGIANIFSRVTGNNRSDIMGTLGVLGDANLFLINPNGILFGPNATLDVRGAFHASTASEITFPDGNTFSALEPGAAPLLTVDVTVPIGVEFAGAMLGDPVGDLTNEARLAVDSGQTLTLQGHTVISRGGLVAPQGTVQLLGNRVRLMDPAQVNVGNLNIEAVEKVGITTPEQLRVAEDLQVAVTAPEGVINVRGADLEVVGDMRMEGDGVNLNDSNILGLGNLSIESETLRIRASDVNILGDIRFDNDELRIAQNSNFLVLGRLQVENNQLLVRDSQFLALDMGNILEEEGLLEKLGNLLGDEESDSLLGDRTSTIRDVFNTNNRQRDIVFSSSDRQIFDNSGVLVWTLDGQGRNMQLMAEELDISNSSRIFMFSIRDSQQGNLSLNVGNIRLSGIEAAENIEESVPNFLGLVNFDDSIAGALDITANELLITNSSLVTTASFGREQSGNLDVEVERLRISGSGGNPLIPSILASTTLSDLPNGEENESGRFSASGNVTVRAREILLEAGGVISAVTISNPGGQILVDADEITITGRDDSGTSSGIESNSFGQGNGGVVIVRANSIDMDNLADISTSSRREQKSLIEILTEGSTLQRDLDDFADFFSELDEKLRNAIPSISQFLVGENDSGDSNHSLAVDLDDFLPNLGDIFQERINDETEIDQPGSAGGIFLYVDSLSMRNRSEIFARTRAIGDGGNIYISVEDFLLLDDSNIATTAGTDRAGGDGGNITIRADNGFIVGRVRPERSRDSNIAADAFTGDGGNVNITAQAIFGLEFRDRRTALNDITASSVFGRDGNVLINTLNVDVNRGLVPLPEQLANTEVDDSCGGSGAVAAVEFFVVGGGGSPSTPDDMLDANDALFVDGTSDPESWWMPLEQGAMVEGPSIDVSDSTVWAEAHLGAAPVRPVCQVREQEAQG